jgi:cytochrome d ubiquinol oxidase subunit II
MTAAYVLPIIWACIAAFTILAYIVLDGFDLGLGILFLVEKKSHDRDVMVNTVAPTLRGAASRLQGEDLPARDPCNID